MIADGGGPFPINPLVNHNGVTGLSHGPLDKFAQVLVVCLLHRLRHTGLMSTLASDDSAPAAGALGNSNNIGTPTTTVRQVVRTWRRMNAFRGVL